MQSYLFYDTETTGLSHSFDQILQFAAIRTDTYLQELEQYEFNIRLRPDIVPSPQAVLTNRVTVAAATGSSWLSEYDAIRKIHRLLNAPETLSIGYNSLHHDDRFLRFSFYRNLLPPYTHQFADGCGRADLYPITIVLWLLKPNLLTWPQDEGGKVSLRLENLQAANGLCSGAAHDALVDTRVTVELVRRFQSAEPGAWTKLLRFFDRKFDVRQVHQLPAPEGFPAHQHYGMMIYGRFGYQNKCAAPVLYIASSQDNRDTLWLRLDRDLPALSVDEIVQREIIKKKFGGQRLILPMHTLDSHLDAERRARMESNLAWLRQNPDIVQQVADQCQQQTYPEKDVDAYAALYQSGFESSQETALNAAFHAAQSAQKAQYLTKFSSFRQELALRILGMHYPLHLPEAYSHTYQEYIQRICRNEEFINYTPEPQQAKTTPAQALTEISALLADPACRPEDRALLNDWAAYIAKTFNQCVE